MKIGIAAIIAMVFPALLLAQRSALSVAEVDSNTVALWHFDEGSGTVLHDASIYHNDGEIHNATWVQGEFGSALHFDGLTSYVVLPDSPSLQPENEFTVEAFISLDTLGFPGYESDEYRYIVSNIGPYPYGGGYGLDIRKSYGLRLAYRAVDDLRNDFGGVPIPQAHHFYHIAGVFKRTPFGGDTMTVIKTYIDGVLGDSLVFPNPIYYTSTPYFYIGSELDGRAVSDGGGHTREFIGLIDEIRISKVALDARELGSARLVSSTDQIDFGLVKLTDSATKTFDLSNTGLFDTLHVDTIIVSKPEFSVSTVPFVLPPGEHRTLNVTYSPTYADPDTAILRIAVREVGVDPVFVRLTGRGFILGSAPIISAVLDVPEDQGKQVRIVWYPSIYDSAGSDPRVSEYTILRRVDDPSLRQTVLGEAKHGHTKVSENSRFRVINDELWDFVSSWPALSFEKYSCIAPTLCNATVAGIHWSVFRIAASTPNGDVFLSDPDSGYSIDNLSPPPPDSLGYNILEGKVVLTWTPADAPDVADYAVYRSTYPNLVSSVYFRIGMTSGTSFIDSTVARDSAYYYVVTAIDSSGNESIQSKTLGAVLITAVRHEGSALPTKYELRPGYPNPFNPSTTIGYSLPARSRVTIRVYNILGQVVATLVEGIQATGYYQQTWSAQNQSSGIYCVRMEASDLNHGSATYSSVQKVAFLK